MPRESTVVRRRARAASGRAAPAGLRQRPARREPAPGRPRGQVRARGGPRPADRRAGAGAAAARPAPGRPPPRPAPPARSSPATRARRWAASTRSCARNRELLDEHHRPPRARPQRGARRDLGVGQPARPAALPGAKLRRRARHLVRQGARPRPRRRRAAPRQLRRRLPHRRRRSPWSATTPAASPRRSRAPPSPLLASLRMPVFFPGDVQEVLDLGLHAFALLARVGAVGRLQDRHQRRRRGRAPPRWRPAASPRRCPSLGYEHVPNGNLLPPASLEMERTLLGVRAELALAYARENGVNRIEGAHRRLARHRRPPGKTYYDLRHALRRPRPRRARARARRRAHAQARDDLAARAARSSREFARGLDEMLVVEEKGPFLETQLKEALYGAAQRAAVVGKRDEHGERAAARASSTSTPTSSRAPSAARLRARGVRIDSVDAAPAARSTRSRGRARRAADGAADAVLLLGLPAQLVDQGARRHARRRRHRLPHDGPAQPRGQGRDHRHHADGRRGRAVDRHGAVHRRRPPRPEPRRRHVPPLRLAGRPRGRGRGREHHLQAALQRARRDDRRPGDRGPAVGARPDPLARARGRAPDHRHDRGPEPLQGRRAGADRGAARPLAAARGPAGAGGGRGRDRADPRPGVRRREAPRRASAASWPSRPSGSGSTSASARAAATAARSRAACRCCRSRPSSGARPRSTRPRATRTTPASRATAPRSSRSCRASSARHETPALDVEPARAGAARVRARVRPCA